MIIRKPKGVLIPIGGGEDKEHKMDILARIIIETGKRKPKICIITVATNFPKEVAQDYKNAFKVLGLKEITIVHFKHRSEADIPEHIEKIKRSNAVLMTGGDQLKLSSLLGGTHLLETIRKMYFEKPKFVVAGTSAGAAAMSNTMIISGSSKDAMIKGELELTNGLNLINNVFIDSHFTQRGRFGRLIQTVTCNPGILGVGLGEDTAAVLSRGNKMEVIGSGLVVIMDGTEIVYTDLTELHDGAPITVEGIKMHILGPGKYFLIDERRILKTKAKSIE